ncbi:hypothetical protein JAAARDRAFT_502263 [Jaapia argillacea MUCL 33604]|uniref:Uncharacterized protein n=1 Tax=Jaapia argillacea MUCL 33604 TaxID=933084 RepID=A0A067PA87_9AGAM|nr:hypothetical protein JAAARDRAFT_502263 [Jaapia argillacea MUCL 33604]
MQQCINLTRLPPSKSIKSLNFKRTTPGSTHHLIFSTRPPTNPLDPSHPASQTRRQFPYVGSPGLGVRAFPKGVLEHPVWEYPDPPFGPAKDRGGGGGRMNMSVQMLIGVKSVSRSAVVRHKISGKVKQALALIATKNLGGGVRKDGGRGKGKDTGKGKEVLVQCGDRSQGFDLILPHWTYVVHPSLEVYRMPFPTLINTLRSALEKIHVKAVKLDEAWAKERAWFESRERGRQQRERWRDEKIPSSRNQNVTTPLPSLRLELTKEIPSTIHPLSLNPLPLPSTQKV